MYKTIMSHTLTKVAEEIINHLPANEIPVRYEIQDKSYQGIVIVMRRVGKLDTSTGLVELTGSLHIQAISPVTAYDPNNQRSFEKRLPRGWTAPQAIRAVARLIIRAAEIAQVDVLHRDALYNKLLTLDQDEEFQKAAANYAKRNRLVRIQKIGQMAIKDCVVWNTWIDENLSKGRFRKKPQPRIVFKL